MSNSSRCAICPDASFFVQVIARSPCADRVIELWREWQAQRRRIVAPRLLYSEVSNALYQNVRHGFMDLPTAEQGLASVIALEIEIHEEAELSLEALQIAAKYSLPASCDAHYLALSQRVGADFWTADRRLFNTVHETLPWVHLLGS